jgi:hypothetical protein
MNRRSLRFVCKCRAGSLALFVCTLSSAASATDLELVFRGGPFAATGGEGRLDPLGVEGGAAALLRVSDHFALGATWDTAWIGWSAKGSADGVVVEGLGFPDPYGSMQSTLHAVSLRWYPVDSRSLLPYVDVNAGYLSVLEVPDHPDCSDGSGVSGGLAFGLDWFLATWVRLGGVVAARPFRMGQGCNANFYPGKPPSPPHGGLAVSGQIALTTVWAPE